MHRLSKHPHLHVKHHTESMDEKTREEILTQSIWKLFAKFAIPAIIGMFMYAIYMFADAIFVGQWVGKEGLAAISIVSPLTLVNLAIAMFMGMGSASLLSRAIGAKDKDTVSKILGSNTFFIFLFSVIYMVFGFFFSESLVRFLGGEGTILAYGSSYFRIVVLGSFFLNFVASSTMLIRAEGRIKVTMILVSIGSLLNMALDPIFIKVLDMGVRGAAIATLISMVVAAIATLVYFLRGKSELSFNMGGLGSALHILRRIAPVGAAGMAMQLMTVTEQVLLYKSIGSYGIGDDLALMGASLNMLAFALIPMWGIAQGLQPIVGMNFGAKKHDRVKEAYKKFLLAASSMAVVIWLLFMILPGRILGMYITDPLLAARGANMFRIFMAVFFLQGFIFLPAVLFQAMGKGGKAGFLLIARQVLLFAPIVLVLPAFMGLHGIWTAIPIADTLIVALGLVFVTRELRSLGTSQPEQVGRRKEAQ